MDNYFKKLNENQLTRFNKLIKMAEFFLIIVPMVLLIFFDLDIVGYNRLFPVIGYFVWLIVLNRIATKLTEKIHKRFKELEFRGHDT